MDSADWGQRVASAARQCKDAGGYLVGFLDAVTKPFKAIVDAGKDIVEDVVDVGKDIVAAGGEVLDTVSDIPVIGGVASAFLRANPVTGPAVLAFDAVRGGVNALEGKGLGGLLPLAGAALGAVGVPAPAVDAITGAAKLVDAASSPGQAAKEEARQSLGDAAARQQALYARPEAEGAAGGPLIDEVIRALTEQLRSREAAGGGGGCGHAA